MEFHISVVYGVDGLGKTTCVELLEKYLRRKKA
jgi:thymidylate kinase